MTTMTICINKITTNILSMGKPMGHSTRDLPRWLCDLNSPFSLTTKPLNS